MTFIATVLPANCTFSVDEGQTILAAGIAQGIGLPYACKEGVCGSCKLELLEGDIEEKAYSPNTLSCEEKKNGVVLACRTVLRSNVVLASRFVIDASSPPVKKTLARVVLKKKLSSDVMLLRLQLATTDVVDFRAGQYFDLLPQRSLRRSYSVANAPHTSVQGHNTIIELHVRHMPGGMFTDHVFHALNEKDVLRMEGPFGVFYLRPSDKPLIFIASGTGFAPIKALIEHMQFKKIQRKIVFYWGGRRPDDLYMNDWVEDRVSEMPNLSYVPVVSNSTLEDEWTGRTGFVHKAVVQDFPDLSGYQLYVCGAPIVVESAKRDLIGHCGLNEEDFYADSFVSELDKRNTGELCERR